VRRRTGDELAANACRGTSSAWGMYRLLRNTYPLDFSERASIVCCENSHWRVVGRTGGGLWWGTCRHHGNAAVFDVVADVESDANDILGDVIGVSASTYRLAWASTHCVARASTH